MINNSQGLMNLPEYAEFKNQEQNVECDAKRILIAGEGSYIGESFKKYMLQFPECKVDSFSTKNDLWKKIDFSKYDVIYYVAGIAHVKETTKNRKLYYKVNRDLAVEIAKKAKKEKVRQFIYVSSVSVYGLTVGKINRNTRLNPTNAYGKSKMEAEVLLWELRDKDFTVSIIRPPMVYGKDCKGNYQLLRKFALYISAFPKYNNARSMIYIDNLSSAVRGIICNNASGVYTPQNMEYMRTYDMVKLITELNGKKFRSISWLNKAIKIATTKINVFKKVFGTLTYDKDMNVPEEWICVKSNKESIKMTERQEERKVWVFHHYASLPNQNGYIRPYRFAKRLEENKVKLAIFASSYNHWSGENVITGKEVYQVKCHENIPFIFVKTPEESSILARIKNMSAYSLRLFGVVKEYEKIDEKPDVILASSPHPFSLISGIKIARKYKVPCICEIRDLWPEAIFYSGKIKETSIIGKILIAGEHWIYKNADALIFTKEGDTDYLKERGWTTEQNGDIDLKKCFYINNGIELGQYMKEMTENVLDDPELEDDSFKIVYAGAIRPINNVNNIVEAAKLLLQEKDIKILIYGDGNLKAELEEKVKREKINNVVFKGFVDKKYIPYILSKSSVNLLNYTSENYNWSRGNSSNKLFEYLASGKPVIATIKTGYSIIEKYNCGIEMEHSSPKQLAEAIMKVKTMSSDEYDILCNNAKVAAREFDYGVLAPKLYDVLEYVESKKNGK